jgi:hypothetical protein
MVREVKKKVKLQLDFWTEAETPFSLKPIALVVKGKMVSCQAHLFGMKII